MVRCLQLNVYWWVACDRNTSMFVMSVVEVSMIEISMVEWFMIGMSMVKVSIVRFQWLNCLWFGCLWLRYLHWDFYGCSAYGWYIVDMSVASIIDEFQEMLKMIYLLSICNNGSWCQLLGKLEISTRFSDEPLWTRSGWKVTRPVGVRIRGIRKEVICLGWPFKTLFIQWLDVAEWSGVHQ